MKYEPPLHLHVVYHPKSPHGAARAERLLRWFSGDPQHYAAPQADIPTFVWTALEDDPRPPAIPWGRARRTIAILLVDNAMVADRRWRAWANELASAKGSKDEVLVCTDTEAFANMGEPIQSSQAIRLADAPKNTRRAEMVLRITHAVARQMLPANAAGRRHASLFLSHAKADGRALAWFLKDFLDDQPGGTHFFDEVGLLPGDAFQERLKEAIGESVVVIILTDKFAGRYWCSWEAFNGKVLRRPMLVVNALKSGEDLSHRYLGNVPTLRWNPTKPAHPTLRRRIVAYALLELLRTCHEKERLCSIKAQSAKWKSAEVTPWLPELLTLPPPRVKPRRALLSLLHPDPPLPAYELDALQKQRPDVTFYSLTQAVTEGVATTGALHGKQIAISISDGPDCARFGVNAAHQARLWARLCNHLLTAGAKLAYGGDPRSGGYTEQLLDMVRGAVKAGRQMPRGLVHWYVGWPTPNAIDDTYRANLPGVIELHEDKRPTGVNLPVGAFAPPSSPDPKWRFGWTLGMREMRKAMAKDCSARVMLGGQFRSVSPVPGLVEEFLTFVDTGKPVYLVGAFGGMTRVIIRALRGEEPEELTEAFQDAGGRQVFREFYDAEIVGRVLPEETKVDYRLVVERLRAIGVTGLRNNGLKDEENERLFEATDPVEIVGLVLEGLGRGAAANLGANRQ